MATNSTLFDASDASFKEGRASHAWILPSGDVKDIADEDLHIYGHGSVNSYAMDMSSGRGELAGITAMSIMAQLFLNFLTSRAAVEAVCDKSMCISIFQPTTKNMDLYITQQKILDSTQIKLTWVKGHFDKIPWKSLNDLKTLGQDI